MVAKEKKEKCFPILLRSLFQKESKKEDKIEMKGTKKIAELFTNTHDTCVLSCLQDVMGRLYTSQDESSAIAALGSYLYLGGKPTGELLWKALADMQSGKVHLIDLSGQWTSLLERFFAGGYKVQTRYALLQEGTVFDTEALWQNAQMLSAAYEMKRIDRTLFEKCAMEEWSRDFVCNYDSFTLFEKHGLGYVILKDGELVAGASSYSGYLDGIEISIATREDFRRQGLAKICASKLILECLKKGWYPNWDAANTKSLALAKQLGYHYAGEYECIEITVPYLQSGQSDI